MRLTQLPHPNLHQLLIMTDKLTPTITQPKEKPLRTKRGHRKPSFLTNLDSGRAFISQGPGGPVTLSPSGSDAFSHTHPESHTLPSGPPKRQLPSNGIGGATLPPAHSATPPPGKPKSAFDLYCQEMRSVLIVDNRKAMQEGTWDPDRALAQGWQNMNEGQRAAFQARYENLKNGEKEVGNGSRAADEDVEMGDGDETEVEKEGGGFTAVNRD